MTTQDQLDKLANLYNKTKDPEYRDQWYRLVRGFYGRTSTLHDNILTEPRRFSIKRSVGVHKVNKSI